VRAVAVVALVAVSMLLLDSCTTLQNKEILRLGDPPGITNRTHSIHALWMWSWLAAIIIGVVVWFLIIYAVIRFRRRSDDEVPVQFRYHLPLEILYTVAPVIIVVVLFVFTIRTQNEVLASATNYNGKAQHQIDVVGQQWSWTFNYVKDPALGGQTTVFEPGNTAYEPTLVLPVGQSVTFHLYSPDVIHSFWVPAFLFKLDVIPGKVNHFSVTPTRTGTFQGRCAELCGVYHSRMLFNVKVVQPAQFRSYLQKLKSEGNTGLALGGSQARTEAGLKNAPHNGVGPHSIQNGTGQ
jgi:cytochrome c oxidase subunit 2